MNKIQINGIELAYNRRGKGAPLVLLHGYPLDSRIWNDIVPLLDDTFDLIIPDLRGFGESTTVDIPCTMDTYASDISGLLDHLGIQKTAIAGHSMGGYISLAFARLYRERVTGLGLVASQTLMDAPERKQGRYDTAAQVGEKGIGVVVEAMTSKFTPDPDLQLVARNIMELQTPLMMMQAMRAMAERPDSTSDLLSYQFPVVVVHGNADALIPIERAREVHKVLPQSHFEELEGVGHLPMMESPHATAAALTKLG